MAMGWRGVSGDWKRFLRRSAASARLNLRQAVCSLFWRAGGGGKQWGRKLVPQDPMRVQRERGTGPSGDPRPPRHGTRWTGAGRVGVESSLGVEVTAQIGGGVGADTTRSTTFAMCLGDGDGSPQLGFSAPRLTPFLVK